MPLLVHGLSLALLFLCFCSGRAEALIVNSRGAGLWLGQPLEMLDNRASAYDEKAIIHHLEAFSPLPPRALDTGIWPFHVDYWFKFKVGPGNPKGLMALYRWGRPSRAFFLSDGELHEIEVETPRYWGHASAVRLPQAEGLVLIHVKTPVSHLPDSVAFEVLSEKSFQDKLLVHGTFFSALYGCILIMIVYNASLCFTLRRATHVVYTVYGLFLLAYIEAVWGYASALLHWPMLNSSWAFFTALGTGVSFMLFVQVFLKLPEHYPRFSRVYLRTMLWISVCLWLLEGFNPGLARFSYSIVLVLFSPVVPLLGVVLHIKRRYKPGLYMAISAAVLTFGTIVYVLGLKGLFTLNFLTENIQLLGFVIEMSFLSLGMGKQLRLEQDAVISRMEHSYSQLQKLVYPHQLLMIQDGFGLEKTLPVGKGHAVVLAFDIIQSTKFEHPEKRRLFQAIFQRCYREMMKDYDNLHLAASAFRIKEMGDGFLCSVGFPFKTPFDESAEATAVQLALSFLEIAREEIRAFDSTQPMHVSIGIATGQIEGFFPQSGMRSYELFGEAIVLASRYEGLRKFIFASQSPSHIICVQSRVIEALPQLIQKNFRRFALPEDRSIVVRDDPDARCFYFHTEAESDVETALADSVQPAS